MLTLTWPWALILLPLPLLARRLLPPVRMQSPALRTELYTALAGEQTSASPRRGSLASLLLLWLVWLALLAAATRPQWVGEPVAMPTSGRDLLLAVDISESMKMEDMAVNDHLLPRLTVVKQVVGEFVERRRGDKLGLILFGSQAYLQVPLTYDRETVNTLLAEARIGFAGKATAIGDAIGIAIKRLENRPADSRVLVLLSDGADTASELPPRKAAELAADHGIRIHAVGIGADAVVRRSFFGDRRFNPSADLDEDMLTYIADTTGGQYFRARDPRDLEGIYQTLDTLEPVAQEQEMLRPTRALFYWPLGLALAAFSLLVCLRRLEASRG